MMKPMRLLWLAWQEARPVVQLVFLLRFSAGAALGAERVDVLVEWPVITAAAGWLATTWSIYLVNGVADVVEDRANGSNRPIARGDLSSAPARRTVWLLAVVGLVAAGIVATVLLLLVALMLMVGWAYSLGPHPFKRNVISFALSVTALGILTYLAGWQASGGADPSGSLLLFASMMSLWMALGGSTKDLSDTTGDRLAGRRTLPVILGERRARVVMAGAASLLGWTFAILATLRVSHLLPVADVVCTGSIALTTAALTRVDTADRAVKRRPYKVFMITQYLGHIALFVTI
jgi:4-hydroxybenzoate polyprenyltransferase